MDSQLIMAVSVTRTSLPLQNSLPVSSFSFHPSLNRTFRTTIKFLENSIFGHQLLSSVVLSFFSTSLRWDIIP